VPLPQQGLKIYKKIFGELNMLFNQQKQKYSILIKRSTLFQENMKRSAQYGYKVSRQSAVFLTFLYECVEKNPVFTRQVMLGTDTAISDLYSYCEAKYAKQLFLMDNFKSDGSVHELKIKLGMVSNGSFINGMY
jgi:hypothetical protein